MPAVSVNWGTLQGRFVLRRSDQGNRTAQFEELVGKQKQQSEELQGGVKPEELYSQAAKNRAGESGPPSKSA